MHYLRIFTYPFALCFFILPLFHCRSVYPSPQSSTSTQNLDTNPPHLQDIENNSTAEISLEEKQALEEGVWDLTDVDLSKIDPSRKLIAFSFDDSPSRTLENILAVYAQFNESNPDCPASATIFCNSVKFDAQTPHLLSTCLAMGMELGNHTHSHYDLTTLDEDTLRAEIDKTDKALFALDGKKRHLLRAPFGKTNDLVKEVSSTPIINWTIDTLDWSGVSEDSIYRTVYENRFSGAIVLMHDGYKHTINALKRLLNDLKTDGYQVVSISQLAKAHGCTLRNGSTYIRARKCN